ncbi:hypothetical protein BK144_16465 [Paenibacillus sp. FSL R7-0273]|nr:hypothetical protein BK144_16465 [Paenibacillus sp. FSL R7-0273]
MRSAGCGMRDAGCRECGMREMTGEVWGLFRKLGNVLEFREFWELVKVRESQDSPLPWFPGEQGETGEHGMKGKKAFD